MGQIIRLIDSYTKENVNYEEVTTWYDGSVMDDTKVDNVIYRKKDTKYYKRKFTDAICPEWFGAIGYDNSVILESTYSTLKSGLIDSTLAIKNCVITALKLKVGVKLNALYLISDEIKIPVSQYFGYKGFSMFGNGNDSGFLVKINDETKYVLSINDNTTNTSYQDSLKNFAIYISNFVADHSVKLAGGIYGNSIIRSTFEDVRIFGGYCHFTNGLFTVHSVVNKNIFLNVFNRCHGFNTSSGNGIHYKHETYNPTLQYITNCAFQQLGGCAIVADMLPITGGGFGGIIYGNELEGNGKGAIALSGIGGLIVQNNYFELANYENQTNFFPNLPPAPYTFGVIEQHSDGWVCHGNNLTFINNTNGAGGTFASEYAIIFCGNGVYSGGLMKNVEIVNNALSASANVKLMSILSFCNGISIRNNSFASSDPSLFTYENIPLKISLSCKAVTYEDVNVGKCEFGEYTCIRKNVEKGSKVLVSSILGFTSNYPYPQPTSTSQNIILALNEVVETTKGQYKCIKAGRLHYQTSANYTSGSYDVVCGISIWNWSVGQQVQSDYIETGVATITAINGTTFTLSQKANKTISDWLIDCTLVPLIDNTPKYGTFAQKPTVKVNVIKAGFTYFCTDRQTIEGATMGIMITHKGDDVWVDALGRVVV